MNWLDNLLRAAFGEAEAAVNPTGDPIPVEAVLEAATDLAEEDRRWRALSAGGGLEPAWTEVQQTMLAAAEAYRANPMAFRIVELTADHVVGKGIRLKASDRDLQRWLDAWWSHPENRMATRTYDLCRDLSITGELFVTFHPDSLAGTTYIRTLPAPNVDEIRTDPEDLERELAYHETGHAGDLEGRWWPADRCAHYAVNRLAGCVRGQSDLCTILPWLRRYKDWLTDRVRINRFKGAFLWWVKLSGADRATVERKRSELSQPPSPGSVIVTNEAEEWSAVQPAIDAQAVEPDGRAMRIMLAAGAGVPLHFLAEPEDTNRATAAEMNGPTLRHFENRQRAFGWMLADIARRAALLSGTFTGDLRISAVFEDLTTADNLATARAAAAMVAALATARDRGWVDDQTARATLQGYIGLSQEAVE